MTAAACKWLQEVKERNGDKPWALFVSLVRPHFPLTAPPEFFALYDPAKDEAAPSVYEAGRCGTRR